MYIFNWLVSKANTYTLTYNANGHGTAPADSTGEVTQPFNYNLSSNGGKKATVKTAAALTVFGYTFNGWNTKSDGSGTSYADKASVNNLTITIIVRRK